MNQASQGQQIVFSRSVLMLEDGQNAVRLLRNAPQCAQESRAVLKRKGVSDLYREYGGTVSASLNRKR
jgi:hypothetical protein